MSSCKQIQRHAGDSAIHYRIISLDKNTLLYLQQIPVFFISKDFKIVTSDLRAQWVTFCFLHMLQGGKNLNTTQRLPCSGRYVSVLLKPLFPISGSATNVANIAVSARIFVYNARQERLGEFVLVTEERGHSARCLENYP